MRAPAEDRLLPGEDPQTPHPEDARHWVSVYTQMLEFKERLLDRTRADSAGLPAPARAEVEATDLRMLEDEKSLVAERLHWWRQRHWELARIDIDHGARTMSFEGRVIDLTQRERQLLELLLNNPNRFIPAAEVLDRAWHDPGLAPEQVRSYVTRLRRKLSGAGVRCRLETRPRRGYRLVFD
jgi:DNA-binding response OmpR family regulator